MNAFFSELQWRGFLDSTTSDDLSAFLDARRRTIYIGFDPTADSLHLGNLIPVMALAHAQRHGHRPLVLVGGGTGLIGDPSGKAAERALLTAAQTAANALAIGAQLSKFFDLSSPERGLVLNNADWLVPLNLVEFLRDVGKHFSVNEMMKRDSVRMRLEERDQGITYTEFTYMLLQAYDFLHLFRHYDCEIQMGGRDQWGNILSGKELIRRMLFGEWNASPSPEVLEVLSREVPVTVLTRAELDAGIGLLDILVNAKVAESKGAGRKLIAGGGLYLNNLRQTDEKKTFSSSDLLWPNAALLRSGKKNHRLLLIH